MEDLVAGCRYYVRYRTARGLNCPPSSRKAVSLNVYMYIVRIIRKNEIFCSTVQAGPYFFHVICGLDFLSGFHLVGRFDKVLRAQNG